MMNVQRKALPDEQLQVIEPPVLGFMRADEWEGTAVPVRQWLVPSRIPMGNVTLLSGDGAAGKTTIMLQLAAATAHGTDWFGAVIETQGPAMILTAEEDDKEMHRRTAAIVAHHDIEYTDLKDLHIHCMPGDDAVLGAVDQKGMVRATPLLLQLESAVRDVHPSLIALEAAADLFAGSEIDRTQVRQFIGLLRRHLCIPTGAAVVLIQHPSVAGMAEGAGRSGSTAWRNSVRSQMYFAAAKSKGDDDEPISDVRELRVMKSNYGPAGEVVPVRWQRGVFVPVSGASTIERAVTESAVDRAFLQCLDAKSAQGIHVVHRGSANAAPNVFETMPQAQGFKRKALALAMERLLNAGTIVNATSGPPSKQRSRIARPAEVQP